MKKSKTMTINVGRGKYDNRTDGVVISPGKLTVNKFISARGLPSAYFSGPEDGTIEMCELYATKLFGKRALPKGGEQKKFRVTVEEA